VSGESWTIPNGAVAPGKVWPSPPVPIVGSTLSIGAGALCAAAAVENMKASRMGTRIVALENTALSLSSANRGCSSFAPSNMRSGSRTGRPDPRFQAPIMALA
jgi:hypothetical protein